MKAGELDAAFLSPHPSRIEKRREKREKRKKKRKGELKWPTWYFL